MNVIWKRPDGFHGANPTDFIVADLGSETRLWLHKSDHENFPFRVSGAWQDELATRQLNTLINSMISDDQALVDCLNANFADAPEASRTDYLDQLRHWLESLQKALKGDTWELEIMNQVFGCLEQRLSDVKESFIQES